jgi:hypothetical protein
VARAKRKNAFDLKGRSRPKPLLPVLLEASRARVLSERTPLVALR